LNITILTTETVHHCHYIRKLAENFPSLYVICESRGKQGSDRHDQDPFDRRRDEYEKSLWFGGADSKLSDFAKTYYCSNVNSEDALDNLLNFETDIVLVFGTGLIMEKIINRYSDRLFNLHGGNPEQYRGLDSHLWAVHNKDWSNLVTAIHRVEAEFDTGEIFDVLPLRFHRNDELYMLRSVNTEICVELSEKLLASFSSGTLKTTPQRKKGKYYSAFPSAYKEICAENFRHFTSSL